MRIDSDPIKYRIARFCAVAFALFTRNRVGSLPTPNYDASELAVPPTALYSHCIVGLFDCSTFELGNNTVRWAAGDAHHRGGSPLLTTCFHYSLVCTASHQRGVFAPLLAHTDFAHVATLLTGHVLRRPVRLAALELEVFRNDNYPYPYCVMGRTKGINLR